MKPIYKLIIGIIIFAILISLGFKACNYRKPIKEEKFIEFMKNNDYYIASDITRTEGADISSGDNDEIVVDVTAEIDSLNIKIDYFEFINEEEALLAYSDYCTTARHTYFYNQANPELNTLTYKADYIKTTTGGNYNRYIIRNPDRNVRTIVSRIENTVIVVKDVPDLSYTKVMDSLGKIGY